MRIDFLRQLFLSPPNDSKRYLTVTMTIIRLNIACIVIFIQLQFKMNNIM